MKNEILLIDFIDGYEHMKIMTPDYVSRDMPKTTQGKEQEIINRLMFGGVFYLRSRHEWRMMDMIYEFVRGDININGKSWECIPGEIRTALLYNTKFLLI